MQPDPQDAPQARPAGVRPDAPSQTLSRALTMLEAVAERETPPSIAELAEALDVHRSVAYRMLRTFEVHGLLRRDAAGLVRGAPGLVTLAGGVEQDLRAAALPELTAVSADLGMTAFLVVWDGRDCLTLTTVEPPRGNLVTQRPGTRHPLGVGAPGVAIAAALSAEERERLGRADDEAAGPLTGPRIEEARTRGWAQSRDEVITGVGSVAAPVPAPGRMPAALAVVFTAPSVDHGAVGERLTAAAQRLAAALGEA